MRAVAFLILHGLEGSGPEHWQSWVAGRLRARGHQVAYPDLPDAAGEIGAPALAGFRLRFDFPESRLSLAKEKGPPDRSDGP